MTTDILVDLGEELLIDGGLDGKTLTVGLYNDATDGLTDTSDVGDISTEPTNSNYSRQTDTFTAADLNGDWGVDNDSLIEFDFTDQGTAETVDAAFLAFSFEADDTGDSGASLHLLATAALGSSYDTSSSDVDKIQYEAGDLRITVD